MTDEEEGGDTTAGEAAEASNEPHNGGDEEDGSITPAAPVATERDSKALPTFWQNDGGKAPLSTIPEIPFLKMPMGDGVHEEKPMKGIDKEETDDDLHPLSSRLDPWSRANLQAVLDTARSPCKGFSSSRVASYRPIGTPDIKRDRSLLPKKYMLYHSRYSEKVEGNEVEDIQPDVEPLVLPMRLKGCYWNGERWCGTPFLPRLASARNGYEFLYEKIRKSHKSLIACRSATSPARPSKIDAPSACSTKALLTERSSWGAVPPEAVADSSLRQLSNILDKETRFTAVQENLNRHLRQVSKAIESTRPFSYTRQFTALKHLSPAQKSWKNRPTDSPRQAEAFRRNLESHKWYEDLISMMFLGNRRPKKPEYDILDYIAHALELGIQFNGDEYVKLLKSLEKRGADLNESATSQALSYIRYAIKIPDEVLLEGYLRKCAVIPAFLSSIDVPKNYSRLTSRLTSSRSESVAM